MKALLPILLLALCGCESTGKFLACNKESVEIVMGRWQNYKVRTQVDPAKVLRVDNAYVVYQRFLLVTSNTVTAAQCSKHVDEDSKIWAAAKKDLMLSKHNFVEAVNDTILNPR